MSWQYDLVILLSTYNGAKYLPEQLASLAAQRYERWMLFWRDDGSSDESVAIVEAFSVGQPEGKVQRLEDDGMRLGPLCSFLTLLHHAPGSAINFAFCDQDDVWLPQKLERAVAYIQSVGDAKPVLYCSRVKVVDADLREIGQIPRLEKTPSLSNALAQNIAAGCTIVLNRAARNVVTAILPPKTTMHDWWCYIVVAATDGHILVDDEPGILYRQHDTNEIGIPPSIRARLMRAWVRGPDEFMESLYGHANSLLQGKRYLTADSTAIVEKISRVFIKRRLLRLWSVLTSGLHRQGFLETIGLYTWLVLASIRPKNRPWISEGSDSRAR